MGPRVPWSEKLKQRNLAHWQSLTDKALDAGLPCKLCGGPLNPGRATLECFEEGAPLEPYASTQGYYAPVKPERCASCLDLIMVLSHRPYWVQLESAEKIRRKQMGLDEQGA